MTDLPDWLNPNPGNGVAADLASSPVQPDQAADHLRIATENGVPREMVQDDPEPFQRMSRQSEIQRQLSGLSALPNWLNDPDNAALASDDLSTLSSLERAGRFWADRGRRAAQGAAQPLASNFKAVSILQQGIAEGSAKGVVGRIADLQERRAALVLAREDEAASGNDVSGYDNEIAQIDQELATAAFQKGMAETVASTPVEEMTDYAFGERIEKAVEDTVGAPDPSQNEDFTAQLASGAGQILGLIGATLVSGPFAPITGTVTASSMGAAGQFEDAIASGADEETALTAAGLGALTGATDIIPLMRAMKPLERYVPGLRGRFVETVKKVFKSAGEEAAQEALQTTLENLIAADLYDPERGTFDNVGTAAAIGAILGGSVSLAGSARTRSPIVADMGRASQAGETAASLQEVDEIIAGSKLKDRAPDRLRDFIQRTGLDDATLRVNAEDLNTFFQNEVPADALKIGADVFEEALASGGTVEIPGSVYAASISGTDMASWFHENATLSENEMSLSEAQRFNETWTEAMQEAFDQAQADVNADLEARAGDVQVRDAIFSQLRAAGRSPDVADRESQVWGAFFRTMGERYGEDPLDLARQFGVRIEGPQSPEQRVRGNLDISLNTLRKKGVPKAQKNQTLQEFVISRGGISGIDGEFGDMPDGFYAGDATPDMLGGGNPTSFDEVAQAALEAGSFPELQARLQQAYQGDASDVSVADVFMDALNREITEGVAVANVNDVPADTSLADLADELDRRGLDIDALTNDEIVSALQDEMSEGGGEGTLLFQAAPPVESDAFRAWFGDSQVVDDNGNPLVVYHGTDADFEAFNSGAESATGVVSDAFFFTASKGVASGYGDQQIPIYLKMEDALTIDFGGKSRVFFDGQQRSPSEVAARAMEISEDQRNFSWDTEADLAYEFAQYGWDNLYNDPVDGLILKNIDDSMNAFGGEITDHYVAFSPEQIKSVHNRGTFDPEDPRILYQDNTAPRGSITFPAGGIENGESVIKLFEGADLSTLLHESGHFFLEGFKTLAERADTPEGMAADLKAINAFLGHSEGAYSTDAQEKWARGFEAYLMEGKAPSLELADAFSRFKAWLTRIYKTALGLNVKLTPEIREIMDRMLATDEEIAVAREEHGMKPLFSDANVAGMSDAEFKPYQRMAQRSAEQASAKLLKKTMDKVRREKEAWHKAEKKAVREEVEASANRRIEYRLIEAFANQRVLGTDEAFDGAQMDRKELVARFGDGVLAEISRTRLGGKRAIYTDGGESLDVVAEIFGFRDADEMVRVLQNTVKRKDFIAQEVDRIMIERHGDPLSDGSIEEEALAAIHTEQQAETVATEARQLAKRIGKDHRNINSKIFRQRAKAMIGRMQVRQAAKPAGFLMAERQAARSAQRAFSDIAAGRGDPEERLASAQRFKEQQLLNQHLYMESRDLEAEVKRGREKMRAYDKAKVREKLAGDYIEQIDGLLQDYEFRVTSQKQIERNSSLAEYVDRMIADGREAELAIDQRLIDSAGKTHYSRLSVDELRGLFDTVANIDHMGRFKQKLIDGQRKRDLDESVGRVVGQIRSTAGGGRADRNKGVSAKARSALNLLWSVDTIAMEYDNWQEFGAFYDEVKSGIDRASAEEQRMSVDLAGKMEDLFSVYSAKELAKMQDKKSIDGANGRSWSKMEVIAAALNTGNDDNLQRLLSEDAYESRRLNGEQLDALLNTLDKRDWDFVQSMWDAIDSYWPQLAEVEQRRTGVKPQKVDPKPVHTKFGTLRGGYYPIKYDADLPGATVRDEESAFDRFVSAGRGSRAAVKNGMTKARQQTGGGRTLKFDLQVPFAHLRDTIRLITLSETVDATHRILNDDRVRDALIDAGRADDRKLLNLWLKDVAEGPIFNSDFVNATARTIKNNFTLSKLAFNMKTVALQLTGLGQAAATIGKRNMLKGLVAYGKDMSGTVSDVMARSAFMSERQTTFQKDLYDFANDVKISSPIASRYSKGIGFVSKLGFWPIQKLQFYAVDMPTWLGAYHAELSKGVPEEAAVQHADRLVARSQASGMMGDRAAVERGTLSESTRQSDLVKIWTTLGSYMLAKMNRGRVEVERIARDVSDADLSFGHQVGSVLDGTVNLMLLYVFEALVMGLAYSLATDDEDDEAFATYVMAETGSALVAGIPFVRDVAGGVKGFDTGGVLGSTFGIAGNIIEQVEQGENDKGFRRALGDTIGVSTGLPTTQSLRVIEGILDDDTPLFEAMFGRNPLED